MPRSDAELVVERYLAEVLNGADRGAADRLVGNESLKQRVAALRAAFPDLRVETQQLLADGDLAAAHLVGRATHAGLFQGCPPTGRAWTASCTAIYRVQDGRIVDSWVNWDLLAVMEQLGCVERVSTVSA